LGLPTDAEFNIRGAYDIEDETLGPYRAGASVRIAFPPEVTYKASFNSLGCRGPEPADVPEPKIICLGDSLTFGFVDDADTWPAQLDRRLRAEGLTRPVINLSSGHLLPEDELRFLRRALSRLENVGVVVLLVPSNGYVDPIDAMDQTPYEWSIERERRERSTFRSLKESLALDEARDRIRFSQKRLIEEGRGAFPPNFQERPPEVSEFKVRLRDRYRSRIAEMKSLVEEGGASFVLAAFPGLDFRSGRLGFEKPWSGTLSDDLDCPSVDLYSRFSNVTQPEQLLLLPFDLHPSPAGNAIIADAVFDLLVHEGLLEPDDPPVAGL
jgi:lysophospholipase L1-like esterase